VERSPPPSVPDVSPPPPSAPQQPARTTDWRPQTYTVKAGDTLAKIALDHGLDYRELASWNGIYNPNIIRVGQVLVLAAPGQAPAAANVGGAVTAPLVTTAPVTSGGTEPKSTATPPAANTGRTVVVKTEPKLIKLPYSEQALAQLRATPVPPPVAVAPP